MLGQNGKNGAVALKDRKDAHSKPGRRLHSRMCNEGAHSQTPSAHQFVQFMDGTELAPSSYIRSLSIKSSEFHHTQCSIAEYDGTLSYPFLEPVNQELLFQLRAIISEPVNQELSL